MTHRATFADRARYLRHAISSLAVILGCMNSIGLAIELPNARLATIFPPGGQQGKSSEVYLEGDDLEEIDHLIFSHPGITAVQKTNPPRAFEQEPQPVPRQFVVTIAADVPLGIYEARARGRFGVSTSRAFEVSDRSQIQETTGNHTAATAMLLPIDSIVDARTEKEQLDWFQFDAKRGQRLIVRCTARRIDSRLKPVVEVLNTSGEQLSFSRGTYRREPLADFVAPDDGTYRIKISDAVYRGGSPFLYRLCVSSRPEIDFVWPPSGVPNSTSKFTIYGRNLPGGSPVPGVDGEDVGLQQVALDITLPAQPQSLSMTPASVLREPNEIDVQGFVYRLSAPQGASNPVFISLASAPITLEQESNDEQAEPQRLGLPCEVVGQFFPRRDRDCFSFEARKGETYTVDIFSERLNLPTDATMTVEYVTKDDQGMETVRIIKGQDDLEPKYRNQPFDINSHDPALEFTADADGTHRILLQDLYAGSSARRRNFYRLSVRPSDPDFQLLATCKALVEYAGQRDAVFPAEPVLRRGGTQVITVQSYRRGGFAGAIRLTADGLPQGVTCAPITLVAGENQASLVLSAASDAPAWHGHINIVGVATLNGQEVQREAFPSTAIWNKNHPFDVAEARVVSDTMLSVIEESMPLRLLIAEEKIWEVPRGGKLTIPFKIERRNEIKSGFTVDVRGLPQSFTPFPRIPTKLFDAQANEGAIDVIAPATMPPGEYPAYMVAQVRLAYQRNPEGAERAKAKKEAFATMVAQLIEASKAAEATKLSAEQELIELAAKGDAIPADVRKAAEAAKAKAADAARLAAEKLLSAQEEQKVLDKLADDSAEASKPKEVEVFAATPTFVIKVTEPQAEQPPATK